MPEPPATYWLTINAPDGTQIGPPVHINSKAALPSTLAAVSDALALPVNMAKAREGLWYWEDADGLCVTVARAAGGDWIATARRISTALSLLSGGHQAQAQAQNQRTEQHQSGQGGTARPKPGVGTGGAGGRPPAPSTQPDPPQGDDLWIAYVAARRKLDQLGIRDYPHVRYRDHQNEEQVRAALADCRRLLQGLTPTPS